MGVVVSILTLIIPMVGVLAIIVTCVLGGACLIFAPFGLLWIAFRVRSLAQRVAELESLDATLSAAQAPNLVQL